MENVAKDLQRDPQIDSLLANRTQELRLHVARSGGISMQLLDYLGRGRGLGIGM